MRTALELDLRFAGKPELCEAGCGRRLWALEVLTAAGPVPALAEAGTIGDPAGPLVHTPGRCRGRRLAGDRARRTGRPMPG